MSHLSVEAQRWQQHRRYAWPVGQYFEPDERSPLRLYHELMKGYCLACGAEADRESVDVGVGVIHGPWGCYECGWSEDPKYDQRRRPEPYTDQFGMLYPDKLEWRLQRVAQPWSL